MKDLVKIGFLMVSYEETYFFLPHIGWTLKRSGHRKDFFNVYNSSKLCGLLILLLIGIVRPFHNRLLTGYIWQLGQLVVTFTFFTSSQLGLYCCSCSEYMTYVLEAIELEDTTKNYERRNSTGWFASNYVFFSVGFLPLFNILL